LQQHVAASAEQASEKAQASLLDAENFNLSNCEKAIHNHLNREALHIDQIITETGLAAGDINAGLISLRLKGLIRQLPGSLYLRK
jgi:predicted Rossmann fold nucleotide-binding protein DprA/Smf involved in DNA uptake